MRQGLWFAALAAIVFASVLWAKQGVVYLPDGSQIKGDIDESDPDTVIVDSHGVIESFPRVGITSIQYLDDVDHQFGLRLAAMAPRDIAGRIALAHWADDLDRHDLARRAAAEALAIDPSNPRALELMKAINYESDLSHTAPQGQPSLHPAPATIPTTVPAAEAYPDRPYITLDEVNRIRQLELKPDESFEVAFNKDVGKRYLERGEIDSVSFNALSQQDQARRILATDDAALWNDVRILSDPAAMVEFRLHIQPMVLAGCAVSGCHNSASASGGFLLFTGDPSPRAAYSNFFILQHYRHSGTAGTPVRLMIDRTYPEQSLLVQYGLPRTLAAPPHPLAPNLHILFPTRDDPRYGEVVRWITLLLKPEGGEYPGIHAISTQPVN